MAKRYKTQCLPAKWSQTKEPTIFEVEGINGKLGELRVRRGSVEWADRGGAKEKTYQFQWDEFAKHMRKRNNHK